MAKRVRLLCFVLTVAMLQSEGKAENEGSPNQMPAKYSTSSLPSTSHNMGVAVSFGWPSITVLV